MAHLASTLIAVIVSVVLVVLAWMSAGPWALILIPLLGTYVANVFLGGGLDDSPLDVFSRLKK